MMSVAMMFLSLMAVAVAFAAAFPAAYSPAYAWADDDDGMEDM